MGSQIFYFKKSKLQDKLKEFNFSNKMNSLYLKKVNIRLNIFMPYAEGIEHINENTDPIFKALLKGPPLSFLKNIWLKTCLQKISIDNCDSITTFNLHEFSINSFKTRDSQKSFQ